MTIKKRDTVSALSTRDVAKEIEKFAAGAGGGAVAIQHCLLFTVSSVMTISEIHYWISISVINLSLLMQPVEIAESYAQV